MQHLENIFTETDTTYIAPNKYNLTFMVEQSFWHERYRLGTRYKRRKTKHQFCTYSNSKIEPISAGDGYFSGMSFSIPDLHRQKPKRQIEERICFQPIQFTSWS